MSKRPWFSFGLFVPMLAALLLVIAVSCGGSATSTAVPAATAVPATAVPAAAATAVPTAVPAATTAPVVTAAVKPFGQLATAEKELGPYFGYPSLTPAPQNNLVNIVTYESMLFRDVNGDYQPGLAKEWSVAPDNRVWTFKLQERVQFHGGWGEMTAKDVVWSFPEFGTEGSLLASSIDIRRLFSNPDGHFIALDDHTVELDTVKPAWELLWFLIAPGLDGIWVVSKDQVDDLVPKIGLDQANTQLVGTGPWEMTETRTGEFWKFRAVEDHWRKTPFFADLTMFEIPEESTRIANFQVGKVDIISASPDSLPALAEREGTTFMSQPGASSSGLNVYGQFYIGVGTDDERPGYDPDLPYVSSNPDLDSPEWEQARKVREAMAIAINRDQIIEELFGGEAIHVAMWGWAGFESRHPAEWTWEYDLERAKQLLTEAGYEGGGFDVELAPAIRGAPAEVEACEAVGDMWADIGITARIKKVPYGSIRPSFLTRTFNGITCHAIPPYPEPMRLLKDIYDPEATWNGGLEHDWITARVSEGAETFDVEERWNRTVEIGQFIWDNKLSIGLYTANTVYALGPNVGSWQEHLATGDPRRISGLEWAPHRK